MRSNTEFKILREALDSSRLFSFDHLTAQYNCVCQDIQHGTELLNIGFYCVW
jgi:hypothetical protein